jgi:hypothetical protein
MQLNKMKRVTIYLYQKIKFPVRRKMINFWLPYLAVSWKHINCLLTGGIARAIKNERCRNSSNTGQKTQTEDKHKNRHHTEN